MNTDNSQGDLITGHIVPFYHLYQWVNLALGLKKIHRKAIAKLNLMPGQSLIDIGSGTGLLLKLVRLKDPTVSLTGIDPSKEMIAFSRKYLSSDIKLIEAYAQRVDLPDRLFDRAVSVLAFHHIPPEHRRLAIREIWRLLKPSGRFLIVDIGEGKNVFGKILAFFYRNHSYAKNNISVLTEMTTDEGFKIVDFDTQFGFIDYVLLEKLNNRL